VNGAQDEACLLFNKQSMKFLLAHLLSIGLVVLLHSFILLNTTQFAASGIFGAGRCRGVNSAMQQRAMLDARGFR